MWLFLLWFGKVEGSGEFSWIYGNANLLLFFFMSSKSDELHPKMHEAGRGWGGVDKVDGVGVGPALPLPPPSCSIPVLPLWFGPERPEKPQT